MKFTLISKERELQLRISYFVFGKIKHNNVRQALLHKIFSKVRFPRKEYSVFLEAATALAVQNSIEFKRIPKKVGGINKPKDLKASTPVYSELFPTLQNSNSLFFEPKSMIFSLKIKTFRKTMKIFEPRA